MVHYTDDEPVKKDLERTLIFRLTETQWQFLRRSAESQDTTLSDIARQIIEASRQTKMLEESGHGDGKRK